MVSRLRQMEAGLVAASDKRREAVLKACKAKQDSLEDFLRCTAYSLDFHLAPLSH